MNKNQRGFAHLLVLIVLALVVVGGIGYWAYNSGQIRLTPSQKQEVIHPSPTEIPSHQESVPTPTTSHSANVQISAGSKPNWNKFTNLESGFSIEYPITNFKYQQDLKLGFLVATSNPQGGLSPKFFGKNDVWLTAYSLAASSQTLDEYLKSNLLYTNAQKTTVKIDNSNGYKLTYTFLVGPADPMTPTYIYETLVLKNGKIFSVQLTSWSKESLENYQATFDQILSTFKFLQ